MNKTLRLQIQLVFIHLLVWMVFISCRPQQLASVEPLKSTEISGKELTDDQAAEDLIVPYRKPLQEIMQLQQSIKMLTSTCFVNPGSCYVLF